MKKKLICFIVLMFLSINLFCVSSSKLLKQELARKEYQVKVLKKSCEEHKLESILIKKADLLYKEYRKLKEKNKEKKLHKNIDKAFILYRLALSLYDLERSKEQHDRQVESLRITRKQLEYLKDDFKELKLELQK
jgi:hypothetical protein